VHLILLGQWVRKGDDHWVWSTPGKTRNNFRIFVGKPYGKTQAESLNRTWECDVKMHFKEQSAMVWRVLKWRDKVKDGIVSSWKMSGYVTTRNSLISRFTDTWRTKTLYRYMYHVRWAQVKQVMREPKMSWQYIPNIF